MHSTGAAALLTGFGPLARAQGPALVESLKIVNGGVPAGIAEAFSRKIAEGVVRNYANSIVIDTHTGNEGVGAVRFVKDAAPDGATLLQTPMSTLAIYPTTFKSLPYDPVADLAPVSIGCVYEFGFAVGPAVPDSVRTMEDFLTWCKSNESKARFGSPAPGSIPHFIGVLAARGADAPLEHMPYKGMQPAMDDLVGGRLAAACGPIGDFTRYVGQGKCRLIATSGQRRAAIAGGTPTLVEQGMKDLAFEEWIGFFFPARTPVDTITRMHAAIRTALFSPLVVTALVPLGITPQVSTPDGLAARLKKDTDQWNGIFRSLGVKP
jgi:tripartite-type tricarboxylate transporter receptor subunit TctC